MSGVCTELPDTISFFKSSPVYLEFVDSSVSKGAALERLGNMLEIPRSEIAAFGDADNDIQMIRYAGLGVAMANSSEKLLREANYVTRSNNEDGIAVVLEKIIKGEEIIQKTSAFIQDNITLNFPTRIPQKKHLRTVQPRANKAVFKELWCNPDKGGYTFFFII